MVIVHGYVSLQEGRQADETLKSSGWEKNTSLSLKPFLNRDRDREREREPQWVPYAFL